MKKLIVRSLAIAVCVQTAAAFVPMATLFAQTKVEEMAEKMVGGERKTTDARAASQDTDTEKTVRANQSKVYYTSDDLRDPFTLTLPQEVERTGAAGAMPKVNIEGYVWGSAMPQAIIDGAVYGVGDDVKGAKITKIDRDGVTFLYGSGSYTVK